MMGDIGACQGIVGIIGRLWNQDIVFALAANIYHNLGSGQSFGRYVVFKIAGVLETRRG